MVVHKFYHKYNAKEMASYYRRKGFKVTLYKAKTGDNRKQFRISVTRK